VDAANKPFVSRAKAGSLGNVGKDPPEAIGAPAQRRQQSAPARPVDQGGVVAFGRIPEVAMGADRSHFMAAMPVSRKLQYCGYMTDAETPRNAIGKAALLPEDLRAEIEALRQAG